MLLRDAGLMSLLSGMLFMPNINSRKMLSNEKMSSNLQLKEMIYFKLLFN